jgi:hypothetical protein
MCGRPGDCKQLFRAGKTIELGLLPTDRAASPFLLLILLLIMLLFAAKEDQEQDQDYEQEGGIHVQNQVRSYKN